MTFIHRCVALGVVLGCLVFSPSVVLSQDWNEASRLYSQGVHAYFSGRSAEAEIYFSRALAIETRDPRLYYFRALSLLRLGRMDEARGDMMVGADLEAQRLGRFAVGRALERVQGGNRLLLEQYRRQGRASAAAGRERLRRERYPQTFGQEAQVLRRRVVIPLDQFLRPGGPQPLSDAELAALPPFPPRAGAVPGLAGDGGRATAATGGNPFGDDPQTGRAAAPQPPAAAPAPVITSTDDDADATDMETQPTPEAAPVFDEDDPFGGL